MSNRTMNNAPLPTIGSQNWGATLNNYLRTQHYEHAELQEELNNLYEQSTNTIQTVLSSGIVARNIDSQLPGLYASDQTTYIEDGTQILSDAGSYCGFKGYGVIIGGTNFTDILHSGEADDNKSQLKITKTQVDEAFTSSETYDARCVYAYYNSTSKFWEVKFSSELTEDNSISLNPYYICLGVIIKWSSNYYWHYKTMKANLSISSKKWMLDEPHAMLNTYISATGTADSMTLAPFADSNFPNATLTVQALGINPFTTYESGSNELSSDIKQWNLNVYTAADNFQFVVLYKNKNDVIAPISTTSGGALTSITNLSSNATYRLCATAVTIAGKPLLILQKAYSGEKVSKSLFDEDEFGKILYFTDPVELYRLSINSSGNITMTAAVGNGISTVNANGINPHVTTLIRHDDNVLFGEETSKAFHFKTKDEEMDSKFEVVMTQPDQASDTSFVLTNAMYAIANPIKIQNYFEGTATSNRVDNYIKMYKGDNEASYHNITLATHQGGEGAYAHFTGQGYIKLGAYAESSSFNVDSDTPNASIYIKSKNRGTVDSNSNIQLTADYIDSHADGITGTTNDWRLNNETDDYCVIQYSGDKPQIHLGTDSSKKVVIYAGTTTEDPCILVGGGGTKLSSEGLYFPSGSNIDGIKIDQLIGTGTNDSSTFTIDCTDLSLSSGVTYDSLSSLPSVKSWLEDKIINPWAGSINEAYSDIIKNNIENISVRLKRNNGTGFYDVDRDWTYWSNGFWQAPSGSSQVRLTFREDQTILECTAGHYIDVEKIEITFNFTPFKPSILSVGSFNTGIMNIKNIGDSGDAVLVVDNISSRGHLYIKDNNNAIRIDDNSNQITINNNSRNITVNKTDSASNINIQEYSGSVTLNDKFHIKGNICYYDDSAITYTTTANTVKEFQIIKNNPNILWRIYGFAEEQNVYKNYFGQVVQEAYFGNEDDDYTIQYIFLPDLGRYTFCCEIFEDWIDDSNGKGVKRMAGTCLWNPSVTVNLWDENEFSTGLEMVTGVNFKTIQTRSSDDGRPGVYFARYVEYDRICVCLVVDHRVDIANSSGAWAYRWRIYPSYSSSYSYRIAPMCNI